MGTVDRQHLASKKPLGATKTKTHALDSMQEIRTSHGCPQEQKGPGEKPQITWEGGVCGLLRTCRRDGAGRRRAYTLSRTGSERV